MSRLQRTAWENGAVERMALVAFIRKVLIATLSHEDFSLEAMYLVGILILRVIYWLVARTEAHKKKEGG